jgi:predicted peroxiredoxin
MTQELHIVLLSKEPERAYPAIQLALGAVAMGNKAKVYCTSSGLEIVRKNGAEIQLPGFPPLKQLLRDAISSGVQVCACAPSPEILEAMGITKDTVEEGVELEDVVTFLSEALPAAREGGIVTFI